MKLFLVGQNNQTNTDLEIQGVFDSEEKAVAACHNDRCWIGPLELNKEFPVESVEWEGSYFPHHDKPNEN